MNAKPIGAAAALLAAALASAAAPALAQQTLTGQPATVRVEGLEQVVDALRQVERKLDLLLQSRWEYRAVQRNRLDDFGDLGDAVTALGRDGWELVSVNVEEGYLFKRRVLPR